MNEHSSDTSEREPRVGELVSLDGRVGLLRYVRGAGAVVRFDQGAGTKVVPLRRLVAWTDEHSRAGR